MVSKIYEVKVALFISISFHQYIKSVCGGGGGGGGREAIPHTIFSLRKGFAPLEQMFSFKT